MSLVNGEINLILTWFANCVSTAIANKGAMFATTGTKLYVVPTRH